MYPMTSYRFYIDQVGGHRLFLYSNGELGANLASWPRTHMTAEGLTVLVQEQYSVPNEAKAPLNI